MLTSDSNEDAVLLTRGWTSEGSPFQEYSGLTPVIDPNASGVYLPDIPLYRMYNTTAQQHLLTTDRNEYISLSGAAGWQAEGITGFVLPTIDAHFPGAAPLYRLNLGNDHLLTSSLNEYTTLKNEGWTQEGIIGYVLLS